MLYTGTRAPAEVTASHAMARGLSPEGGLYVPASLPRFSMADIQALSSLPYAARAARVLAPFLPEWDEAEVLRWTQSAYGTDRFRHAAVAPLRRLDGTTHVLELWHGPTCAFKDMALQLLPHLMTASAAAQRDAREIVILVATSGDTGKAALEGFRDVAGVRVMVFYPDEGVSPMQRLQMVTQEGGNVGVCAIRGNFDHAQSGVKAMFTDAALSETLSRRGFVFSSANSINWGRLAPQIAYYFSAYADLLAAGTVAPGDRINVAVPTGNFGNILAAYYARGMGLPVARFICASNRNRVLADFLESGVYDINRDFYATASPSMDILISSNLERLLYDLAGRDTDAVNAMMGALAARGRYALGGDALARLQADFTGGWCDDAAGARVIERTWRERGYLCDTHTAVALGVYADYRARTGDDTPTVVASTANPYKFAGSVLGALGIDADGADEFALVERLREATGVEVPAPLASLRGRTERFTQVCAREDMAAAVLGMLGVEG